MKKNEKARRGRRDFTKALAAAVVAAPAALSAAQAQTTPAPEAKAPPNPQPTPAPQQPQQQPPSPVAAAYAAVAEARFGALLTPEEMSRVRRDLAGNVRAAEGLRARKLANADEPDFVFEA